MEAAIEWIRVSQGCVEREKAGASDKSRPAAATDSVCGLLSGSADSAGRQSVARGMYVLSHSSPFTYTGLCSYGRKLKQILVRWVPGDGNFLNDVRS